MQPAFSILPIISNIFHKHALYCLSINNDNKPVISKIATTPKQPLSVTNPCYLDIQAANYIKQRLPASALPFPTETTPKPKKTTNTIIESDTTYEGVILNRVFNEIYEHNSQLFKEIDKNHIKVLFKNDQTRLAVVDTQSYTITFGSKAFQYTNYNNKEIKAILCHELAHILMDHKEFINTPPRWVETDNRYQWAKRYSDHLHNKIDTHDIAALFKATDEAEQKLSQELGVTRIDRKEIIEIAKQTKSETAKIFLKFIDLETEYNKKVQHWNQYRVATNKIIDTIIGEKGASANWREEQADILGFRMFINSGEDPIMFIKALSHTLSKKEPDIEQFADALTSSECIPLATPERTSRSHPSGKWRVYNLWVRERMLRYPVEYKNLMKNSQTNHNN